MTENARWIWADAPFEPNQYVRFEGEFVSDDSEAVIARICVSGEYVLYINGKTAGFGQFANWPSCRTFNEHDISAWCNPGKNRFELAAWHMGIDCSVAVKGESVACFSVTQADKTLLVSSEDTLCCIDAKYKNGQDVPLVTGQLGFSFEYNANAGENTLAPAKLCTGPEKCIPRPVPLLKMETMRKGVPCFQGSFTDARLQEVTPALRMMKAALTFELPENIMDASGAYSCDEGDGISIIFDLGCESSGYFSMDIELEENADIFIGWGEHLKDMRVRTYIDGRNFCAVYHGVSGRNRFEHLFRRMGCRYIQMHIYARKIKINHVGLIPVVYPMPVRNALSVGDKLHEQIFETSADTLELCVHDHYEDCPWREQALYAMDSRIQILCGYYAFTEKKMPKASLELLAGGLREDRLLELCAPSKVSVCIPGFCLAYIVELWEYVLYTGDTAVESLAETARIILEGFETRKDAEGCLLRLRGREYWNFYEWQPGLDGNGPGRNADTASDVKDGLLTAWYAIALESYAKIMGILGRNAEAAEAERKMEAARCALDAFWDEERCAYAAYIEDGKKTVWSELMQALVLLGGGCTGERAQALRKKLMDRDDLIPVTLNDALLRYQALMQEEAVYADFVFEDIGKIWGSMLMQGATSFWETELGEADFHNAGSLCHGWSAVPVYFYYAYGMGLRPDAPGSMKEYPVYQTVLGKITSVPKK